MKRIIILILLSFSFSMYSQEITEFEEVVDYEGPIQVPFAVVENVPVYKGCDESLGNMTLKKCMSVAISDHVAEKFNTKIANELGLPQRRVRISVVFKIDDEGNVTDIKSRAPHPDLEKEAIRVLKLIPKMKKPGYQRGKAVIVTYSLPIIFNIDDDEKDSKSKQ